MSAGRTGKVSVLAVIAGLLVTSGALRFSETAGAAFAEAIVPEPTRSDAEPMLCPATDAPEDLLAALQSREARATEREAQLADRLQALGLAESEIDEKLAALAEAEASLAAMLDLAGSAAESDIGRLTQVYENMPPAEVAALFEEMVPEFSSGFLARMAPEAAAAVMSNLTPTTAYSISVVIAGRHSAVPTQ